MSNCKDCNSSRRMWSQEELENIINQLPARSIPIGGRIFVSAVYRNYFDSSGLGTGIWKDWAICNGQNGTVNFSNWIPLVYDPTNPDPRFQVGDNEIMVDVQLGNFTLGLKTIMMIEKIS